MSKQWTTNNIPDQTGRVIIVTGANSGLGYETTLALVEKNASVIMACRNLKKGKTAYDGILAKVPGANLKLMQLDLGSLDSVRQFAENFRAEYSQLDLLINNAGIMAIPRSETKDGFETQFGVNHLGHFALTGLLIDMIVQTADSRVVNVSSSANFMGRINFDDLMGEKNYTRYGAYGQSKLANVLFSNELQRKLEAAGVNTISLSSDPGLSKTNLQTTTTAHSDNILERMFYPIMMNTMAQSQAMGALTQLFAAIAPQANGRDYISPEFMGVRGYPKKARANKSAYDEVIAKRLWQVSEELTGVTFPEFSPATV